MSNAAHRLTLRQSEAQDRRSGIRNRRQALTNQIRKQKKNSYLARKRNLPQLQQQYVFSTTTSSFPTLENVNGLVQSYCRSPTKDKLQALHDALKLAPMATWNTDDNPLIFFSQDEDFNSAAIPFLRLLRQPWQSDITTMELVLDILVQLTAISGPKDNFGYYGNPKTTWSALLCEDPAWLTLLVQAANGTYQNSIFVIMGNLVGEDSTVIQSKLLQVGIIHALAKSVRHPQAAWALTNAIRSATSTPGSFYFSDNNNLLSPTLLEELLLTEPAVSIQAAWMIESLTSREEETVKYLVKQPTFSPALVNGLEDALSSNDQQKLLPLIQALGNAASVESCVVPLLLSSPQLPQLVGKCLQQQYNGNREVVTQSAFLAACLLYGTGLPDHPSTTVAAPALVPVLFQQLDPDQQQYRSLDERREIANALWSALDLVPDPQYASMIVPIAIPSQDALRPSLSSLVALLESPDSDAVIASVNVLDCLIRRDDALQIYLEEEGIRDALEAVCDSSMEEAAEVAASMLDDFFCNFDDPTEDTEDSMAQQAHGFSGASTNLSGIGRGRGAVIPSWMSKGQ